MAVVTKTDFTGTNGTDLSSHTCAGTGAAGSFTRVGGAANQAQIQSNNLDFVGTTLTLYHGTDNGSANHYVQATAGAGFESYFYPLVVRASDENNWIGFRTVFGAYEIYEWNAGVPNLVATAGGGGAAVVGGDVMYMEASGTTITVKKNGVTVVSGTSSFNSSATKSGLVTRSMTGTDVLRDWESGSLASAPTQPSGVTVGSVTASSGSVSWTDNSSDETGFKVRYAPSPYSSWTTATHNVAASPYLVTGLTDNTSYKAAVAAFNGAGDSSWVESGVFTTTALSKLRPNADTSTGSWSASSGSVLYSMIDEVSADDADYISANSATTCKIKIETSTDPADNTNHSIRIRARSTSGTLTVKLVQGNPAETTIVSWAPTLTSSFANYQYDLSTDEASVITDYSALYLKFTSS